MPGSTNDVPGMFLSAYHFDGSRDELLSAYQRLMQHYPVDRLELHVCLTRQAGITIFDACPSREVFERFSQSEEFRSALSAAGLPAPRLEPLGEVHAALTREMVPV